jgi:hypothetical protein
LSAGEEELEKEESKANSIEAIHKDSESITESFPDVCETPSPAGPIPIPYPNITQIL